jgi:hypothetical protein
MGGTATTAGARTAVHADRLCSADPRAGQTGLDPAVLDTIFEVFVRIPRHSRWSCTARHPLPRPNKLSRSARSDATLAAELVGTGSIGCSAAATTATCRSV